MDSQELLFSTLDGLEVLTTDVSEEDLVNIAVEVAQSATGSTIAYLHFLNDDQETIELVAWSEATLKHCQATYDRHYPLAAAGIWGDAARTGLPCIHNDYSGEAGRRGLPPGHVTLSRHLCVPVLEQGRVRMLIGVGNKYEPYEESDTRLLDIVARRTWSLVRQRRMVHRLLSIERQFVEMQNVNLFCGLQYDCDLDQLVCDPMFATVFRIGAMEPLPVRLEELLAFIAPEDHQRVRWLLGEPGETRREAKVRCRRPGGDFTAELRSKYRRRELGRGFVAVATLQDCSQQVDIDALRHRAETDPLTGLPNRHRLHSFLDGPRDAPETGPVAFHYIDLDGFKPVNDVHGHLAGDELLRIIGKRLQGAVREEDLVVRLGGDEFAVVQSSVEDSSSVLAMAEKVIAAVEAPIVIRDETLQISASVGAAIRTGYDQPLHEVIAAADRALYQAKAAGGGRAVFWH